MSPGEVCAVLGMVAKIDREVARVKPRASRCS